MKEKIEQLIAGSRDEVCNSCGKIIETDNPETTTNQILALLKEEIKKGLLTDGKIGGMWQSWIAADEPSFEDAKKIAIARLKIIAQAQLDKVLNILEDK